MGPSLISGNLHDHKNHCFMEFHTRLRRFISGKKWSLFLILPCTVYDRILPRAIGLFNHRQTAMYRGRRSVLRTNRIGNISTNDWPIIISYKTAMDRGRGRITGRITRPSHHNLSPRLCPSASSALLDLLYKRAPSTATRTALPSTINWGQALELWVRLKLILK